MTRRRALMLGAFAGGALCGFLQGLELTLRNKLPTMWEWAGQVCDGGLLARTTFGLVCSQGTARAIGLSLLRADEVVE